MAEALTYLATLGLFSFVVVGAALIRHEMLILISIPPVFVALITGFVMALYAQDSFGMLPVVAALALAVPPAVWLGRRFSSRDMLIAIYLAWTFGMTLALAAFTFPDRT
jgi:uncharacterized membrane protein YqaE (UPF0057 family)